MTGRNSILLAILGALNVGAWIFAAVLFRGHPIQLGAAFLAYGFGLRHAVDADHIAAIDSVTRKLMQEGRVSADAGLFFSLGHSTIVVALSLLLAVAADAMRTRFTAFASLSGIVGTSASIAFLLVLAIINLLVLIAIHRTYRRVKAGGIPDEEGIDLLLGQRGFFGRIFRGLFGLVRRSWHMYPIGVLFGLGFDTATEVGLLGLSAAEASRSMNVWYIMVYPALFTAGMALVDTADSMVMTRAYGWALANPLRKLTYNMVITGLSVVVALAVGTIEVLGLLRARWNLGGRFWNGVGAVSDHFTLLGYAIVALFVLCWAVAVLFARTRRGSPVELSA
jgi:high-affinity nickel-transport protein